MKSQQLGNVRNWRSVALCITWALWQVHKRPPLVTRLGAGSDSFALLRNHEIASHPQKEKEKNKEEEKENEQMQEERGRQNKREQKKEKQAVEGSEETPKKPCKVILILAIFVHIYIIVYTRRNYHQGHPQYMIVQKLTLDPSKPRHHHSGDLNARISQGTVRAHGGRLLRAASAAQAHNLTVFLSGAPFMMTLFWQGSLGLS